MNKHTQDWVFKCKSAESSELVQRIAFSFGYQWLTSHNTIQFTDKPYLVFYPTEKRIRYFSDGDDVNKYISIVAYTPEEALYLFNNPPMVNEKTFADGAVVLYRDGSVKLNGITYTREHVDDIIAERKEFIS